MIEMLPAGCLRIGWDLGFQPKQLQAAYWREQGSKYTYWDMQVAGFLLIVLTFSIFRNASASTDPKPNVWAGIPAWLVLAAWLLVSTMQPKTYREHRTPFVVVFKSTLALAVVHLTNDGGRLVAVSHDKPSSAVLLLKATSMQGLVHLPALCVGLPLPFWPQLGWVLARMAMFCLGGASQALVIKANTHPYLEDISAFNLLWMRIVQSGSHHTISADTALQDRSYAMTLALFTMHLSVAAVSMYLAYISQWIQMRAWLQNKAQCNPAPNERPSACLIDVGGVLLTPRQLQDMSNSHATTLLLDARGALGIASMVCLHVCVLHLILLLMLLLSHVLVLQVGPRVLSGPLLTVLYPLRPELGGDVCKPEDEPQFTGFLGSLLFVTWSTVHGP